MTVNGHVCYCPLMPTTHTPTQEVTVTASPVAQRGPGGRCRMTATQTGCTRRGNGAHTLVKGACVWCGAKVDGRSSLDRQQSPVKGSPS